MNYTGAKVFTVLFCSAFMIAGAFLLLAFYIEDEFIFVPFVVGLGFLLGGAAMMHGKLLELSQFQKQNYAAYRANHPELVSAGGIECSSCGSRLITARALMRHQHHREHFCTTCGKTLYYSPEQND